MKTSYIFLANGFEEIEALTVVDLLRRDNIDIKMVSTDGSEYVTGSHGIYVKTDMGIDEVNEKDAEMYVLPGGMPGSENLYNSEKVKALVMKGNEDGKRIAAICAAPGIIGRWGLLKGKKAVCFPGNEEKLVGAEVLYEEVVTDGNITTSRGMGTSIAFGLELIRLLDSEKVSGELKERIIYRV